ncbi:MAG: DUF2520 domain-containing protein [Bacteroidetes bacterium]|nr:DUF2520 domain-containing protein [Bacteroidota bacterium]
MQTARNATQQKPSVVQTGPAKRKDMKTIKEHRKLLEGKLKELKVYNLMTDWLLTANH